MGDLELNAANRGEGTIVCRDGAAGAGIWIAAVVACAAITLDVALRLGSTGWWRVIAERPPAVWPIAVDVVALALVPGLVARLVARREAWPISALLLVTTGFMHVVGRVLVFGFHDVRLGVAWSAVTAAVVLVITAIAWRERAGRAVSWRLMALQASALLFFGELAMIPA